MSWLEQLQPASWRGVPFEVDTVEVTAGDNVVLREYPFADLPAVFRMGTAAETIKFSAYVIGPDYQARRDALREVLTGEGVLVHPTAGAIRAFVADTYRMTEAPLREGTVVKFELTFVLAQVRTYPSVKASTTAQATEAASAAEDAAVEQFGAEFDLAAAPAWVQERVLGRLGDMTEGVWAEMKSITAGLAGYTDQAVATFQALRGGLTDLVSTPAALAGAVRELFALPDELAAGARSAFMAAFQGVFGLGAKLPRNDFETIQPPAPGQLAMYGAGDGSALSLDTSARRQLEELNGSVDRLFDAMALAAWVRVVAQTELAGHEQVLAQRAWLYEQGQRLLRSASSSAASAAATEAAWHDQVLAMITAGLHDMTARGQNRSRLSAYTPQVCMSVWQLSYVLYGTADWADEILANNPHIVHPLLVPAGKPVRVVQHG